VAWGQVFHKFSPVKIVPLWPFIFIYHLGVWTIGPRLPQCEDILLPCINTNVSPYPHE
jgi:hypothetical protein